MLVPSLTWNLPCAHPTYYSRIYQINTWEIGANTLVNLAFSQQLCNNLDFWTYQASLVETFSMNSLYTTKQTDDASIRSLFVWAMGLWKQIDCCCCYWQTQLHSPCSSWQSTEEVMWHPSAGCENMPGTAQPFSSVTLQPTTSPCSLSCHNVCVSVSHSDNFSCSPILLNCS